MSDEPLLNDQLSAALQEAIDRKLQFDEQALMTLSGASGEGLVVTDRRVLILREQMPIVGLDAEVDCFEHSFEQIRGVLVESSSGCGRLTLILVAPPPSDYQTTLFFHAYDLERFELAASRLRVLAMPLSEPSVNGAVRPIESVLPEGSSICRRCGASPRVGDLFCAACGAPLGSACAGCGVLVRESANYCSACGMSASLARLPVCGSCGKAQAPHHAFCTACGHAQRAVCGSCGRVAAPEWACCAYCGNSLAPASISARRPFVAHTRSTPVGAAVDADAEEHNQRGMSLYEQERFAEAAVEFEFAVALAPASPLFQCNLGVVHAETGRDDEALQSFEAAMRLDPNCPTPHLNLGYFHAERGRRELALAHWRRVIELAPGSPEAAEAIEARTVLAAALEEGAE